MTVDPSAADDPRSQADGAVITEAAAEIASGYEADGAALALGAGETKTLQGIAEQLSAAGVPVVMADVKGDLSGLSAPGAPASVRSCSARCSDSMRPRNRHSG